jgi:hypothetical protein
MAGGWKRFTKYESSRSAAWSFFNRGTVPKTAKSIASNIDVFPTPFEAATQLTVPA